MATTDPRLGKWVYASLSLLIQGVSVAEQVKLFVEGVDEETPDHFQRDNFVLRVNGPSRLNWSGSVYNISVQVVVTDIVRQSENSYTHFTRCGAVAAALEGAIPIHKWGDGDEFLACLVVDPDGREAVKTLHFGQVDPALKVRQSAVLANYLLYT